MLKNASLVDVILNSMNSTQNLLHAQIPYNQSILASSKNVILPLFILNEYGIIGGVCSLIALILACHQIIMHLYFFNNPKLQLYIVRILLMVPVIKEINIIINHF